MRRALNASRSTQITHCSTRSKIVETRLQELKLPQLSSQMVIHITLVDISSKISHFVFFLPKISFDKVRKTSSFIHEFQEHNGIGTTYCIDLTLVMIIIGSLIRSASKRSYRVMISGILYITTYYSYDDINR